MWGESCCQVSVCLPHTSSDLLLMEGSQSPLPHHPNPCCEHLECICKTILEGYLDVRERCSSYKTCKRMWCVQPYLQLDLEPFHPPSTPTIAQARRNASPFVTVTSHDLQPTSGGDQSRWICGANGVIYLAGGIYVPHYNWVAVNRQSL